MSAGGTAPRRRMAGRGESGAVTTTFLLTVIPIFVLLLGMVFDFAQAYTANTRAINVAEQAARAGAQELNLVEVREHSTYVLDRDKAAATARQFLGAAGFSGDVKVVSGVGGRDTVEVSNVAWSSQNAFLGLINIPTFSGHAAASARIAVGVDTEVP